MPGIATMLGNIFARAYDCLLAATLAEPSGTPERGPAQDVDALGLLERLGYVTCGIALGAVVPTAVDMEQRSNRIALLRLASRLEHVFQVPSNQAPNASFLASELRPESFGLSCPDGDSISVSGRGLSLTAAFEGCVGEAAEYLSFLVWGDEVSAAGPDPSKAAGGGVEERYLDWMLGAVGYDQASSGKLPNDWTELQCFAGGPGLPLPFDLVYRRDSKPFHKAESSGCAAGESLESAQYAALMELVERDAVALWWYGGLPAGPLALTGSEAEELDAFSKMLRPAASRRHWFLDITNDIGVPAVAALSSRTDGSAVICGFAADVDPLSAARKALLELCQMELSEDVVALRISKRGRDNLHEADLRLLERLARMHISRFSQLMPQRAPKPIPSAAGAAPSARLERGLEILRQHGFAAFWIDLTRAEIGIASVRVIVPELQSIKVSYITNRLKIAARTYNHYESEYFEVPPVI